MPPSRDPVRDPGADPGALDPDDAKLITLARSARTRAYTPYGGLPEGAAVRDCDGRTYVGASVEHRDPALAVTALRAAVVVAAASGARAFEAAAVVSEAEALCSDDRAMISEFTPGVPVLRCGPDGTVRERSPA